MSNKRNELLELHNIDTIDPPELLEHRYETIIEDMDYRIVTGRYDAKKQSVSIKERAML